MAVTVGIISVVHPWAGCENSNSFVTVSSFLKI
jgi:hypothetical protein